MTGTYGADRHYQRRLVKRSVKFGRACQPLQDQIDRRSLKVGLPSCGGATGGLPRAGKDPAGRSRRPRDSVIHTALQDSSDASEGQVGSGLILFRLAQRMSKTNPASTTRPDTTWASENGPMRGRALTLRQQSLTIRKAA